MKFNNILLLWSFVLSVAVAVHPFAKNWENIEYSKTIDVAKSFSKEKHIIKVKNINTEPSKQYIFAVPKDVKKHITLVVGLYQTPAGKNSLLQPKAMPISDDDLVYYMLELPYPIAPGSQFDFAISYIITNQFTPYPEFIEMEDNQVLKLSTNAYPLSPYDTQSYELIFSHIREYQELNANSFTHDLVKSEIGSSAVKYSSTSAIPANSLFTLDVTFVKNAPLPFINYLKRDLWVSHWSGVLQLVEYYELTNHAAKLSKGFSRAKYLASGIASKLHHCIAVLRIPFDKSKKIEENSMYYVDKVGNVSTSQFNSNELLIRPRFPIFGGWHYNFTIGWDYALNQFVRQNNEEYILKANILDGIYDATYDQVELNVYLPEGAEIIDYALPFGIDEPTISHETSYLDVVTGHTRITFRIENLIDEMKNLVVVLRYRYTTYAMFYKPLQASFYVFLALMGLYILKKIDISIKPQKKEETENVIISEAVN